MADSAKKEKDTPQLTPQEVIQIQLDGMGDNERLDFLDVHAHSVKEEEYRAPLSEDELGEVKGKVTKLSVKHQELLDKKKQFMDELNEELKPLKEDLEETIREARSGERVSFGKVWYVPNADAKTTFKIVEGNVIVGSRAIRREEMGTIFTLD